MNPKVKICAIAKDEGPYLAYWIYHHLYFGFDEVHVCLNRTSDNSAKILDEIGKDHPNVTYSYYDWVDFLRPQIANAIQTIAYSSQLQHAREQRQVDYIFFIDIDEFWCPADWKTDIKGCLAEHGMPKSISFQWALEPRSDELFGLIRRECPYRLTGQIKTALHIDAPVKTVRFHIPEYNEGLCSVVAGGKPFVHMPGNDQVYRMQPGDNKSVPYFLVHRVCRSKLEYMSSLLRGNPNENTVLKLNRGAGYFGGEQANFKHAIPEDRYTKYVEFLWELLDRPSLRSLIQQAEVAFLERASEFYAAVPEAYSRNREQFLKCIKGLDDARLRILIDSLEAESVLGGGGKA